MLSDTGLSASVRPGMIELHHYDARLTADPARVVIRRFHIAPDPRDRARQKRPRRIVEAVLEILGYQLRTSNIELTTAWTDTAGTHTLASPSVPGIVSP